ncbi:MAG: SEC59/DGK1/VTE5 family protein [Treponema sp.]|jgi:dolichol kinase|nr:SEC59/DGK1/VTE5 family protein [Treponema sp.]
MEIEMEKARQEVLVVQLPKVHMGVIKLREVKTEIIRKAIHFLIGLSPTLAALNHPLTMVLLMAGTLFYAWVEYLRLSGVNVPLISSITNMASRTRDKGRFVLGPVTLGLGALLSLLLYPSPAATIAIYALAFGDGVASLVGKLFGHYRPTFLRGKSIEGSIACFMAVFFAAYQVCWDYKISLSAAISATFAEALPIRDYDNLIIPLIVGFTVKLVAGV